jgi:hypothetical protein
LLWVYYSSMILLFGAEFTRVYAEKHGSRIGVEPHEVDPNAKKEPDPKTAVGDAGEDRPVRVPTTRGDVQREAPPPGTNAQPRATGRPL